MSGFKFDSSIKFGAQSTPATTTAAGGFGGFNFGGAKPAATTTTATGGFSLGGATNTTSAGGFSLGGTTNTTPAGGFSLGGATTTPAGGGFGLGGATSTTAGGGFSLGGATSTPASGLGALNATTTATSSLGGFGAKTTATTGLSLGGLGAKTSTPAGLGGFTATSTSAGGLGGLGATSTPTLGGLGATSTPTLKDLGATSTAATTTPTLGGGLTTTTVAGSLGGLSGGGGLKLTSTSAPTTGFGTSVSTASSTAGTTLGGATSKPATMNYRQLEDSINKWTTELEDQEKIFLQQATQVNAWDRLLIENGEKITQLNTDVEKVKLDQQRLDHELDFIQSQQTELEDMLKPLESAVEALPPISYQHHADLEREHTYQLAENIDGQLKRMVQDLTDIIEHLNSTNSKTDSNDPVQQIAKILNAHMDSLQWVDQNTVLLQKRVEDVAKQSEIRRKEQERNVRLAYK